MKNQERRAREDQKLSRCTRTKHEREEDDSYKREERRKRKGDTKEKERYIE